MNHLEETITPTHSTPDYELGVLNEQQLELFFSSQFSANKVKHDSDVDPKNKKTNLGQVFTPPPLARFMVGLIDPEITPDSRILDPCIGPNTFFSYLSKIEKNPSLVGIELDQSLITDSIREFYSVANRTLLTNSFFNYQSTEKFDFIIQNPPYVRQELLTNGANTKSSIHNACSKLSGIIPSQSNLYIYFLLKSILHLKEGGKMVAVIYDSWLFSSFGKFLKRAFCQLGHLERIYHFKSKAFPNAEVGATVIVFKKTPPSSVARYIKYYSLKSTDELAAYNFKEIKSAVKIDKADLLTFNFNEESIIDFDSKFFLPLSQLSSQPIQRGISAIANKYFIQSTQEFPESLPFIKDVSKINSFEVRDCSSFFIAINGTISTNTKAYLDWVKDEILAARDKFKAIKDKINKCTDWYKISIKRPGNVVFNYYLRNNIDFLFNPKKYLASDNFYIMNFEKDINAQVAVLNSSFSRLAVLTHSRNQGNGLRKIQLYEFKELPIIPLPKLRPQTIEALNNKGRELLEVQRFSNEKAKVVQRIDELLLDEYNEYHGTNIDVNQLHENISKYIKVN